MLREALRVGAPALGASTSCCDCAGAVPPADLAAVAAEAARLLDASPRRLRRDENRAAAARARLPICAPPAARRELPLLSQLLGLCARGDRAPRRAQGFVARAAPHRRAATRIMPAGTTRFPEHHHDSDCAGTVHGYPTPDSVCHLFVLGAVPLGGVAARAPAAAVRRSAQAERRLPAPADAPAYPRPRRPGGCRARQRRARRASRRAKRSRSRTDLYMRRHRYAGRSHHPARAERAPRHRRQDQALPAAAEKCRPHVRRASRACSAKACPTTARSGRRCPGRASSRPAPTRSSSSCRRGRQRRQGRADADLPSRQLRDRRRLRDHQRAAPRRSHRTPTSSSRATPRRSGTQKLDGALVVHRPRRSTTKPTNSRKSTSATWTSCRDPSRKLPYTKNADNGWVGMVEHYFVAAWLPPDEPRPPREFYARSSTTASTPAA